MLKSKNNYKKNAFCKKKVLPLYQQNTTTQRSLTDWKG